MTNPSHTPKWIRNLLILSASLPVAILIIYYFIISIQQYQYINSGEYRNSQLVLRSNLLEQYESFLMDYTNRLEQVSRQRYSSVNEGIHIQREERRAEINIDQLKYIISEMRSGKSEYEAWKSLELKQKRENPFR